VFNKSFSTVNSRRVLASLAKREEMGVFVRREGGKKTGRLNGNNRGKRKDKV